jgi:hypothetical protein
MGVSSLVKQTERKFTEMRVLAFIDPKLKPQSKNPIGKNINFISKTEQR